jgi:prephenate dehydratase
MFYVDLEADAESEALKPIFDLLADKTDYLKILGSY